MMRNILTLAVAAGVCSVVFGSEPDEQQLKESKESIKVAKKYLKQCKADNITVSIGNLDWDEVRTY